MKTLSILYKGCRHPITGRRGYRSAYVHVYSPYTCTEREAMSSFESGGWEFVRKEQGAFSCILVFTKIKE